MRHPERRQGVDGRVDYCGAGTDRSRLTRAFDAERVGDARDAVEADVDRRDVVRARQSVIDEGAGEELPRLRIVDGPFEQCLADALGNSPCTWPVSSSGLTMVPKSSTTW